MILFETAFLVEVDAQAEYDESARFGDARQFIEGVGRGVTGGEDAHADDRVERISVEAQLLAQGHLVEFFVKGLPAGFIQHPHRQVHGVEVAVA